MSNNRSPQTNAAMALAAALAAGTPLAALADPTLSVAFRDNPYTLTSKCDLAQPIVFVKVKVRNAGDTASAPGSLYVIDDPHVLYGVQALPAIGPGRSVALTIPMRIDTRNNPLVPPLGPTALAGAHTFTVGTGILGPKTQPLAVTIPASLCADAVQAALPGLQAAKAAADAQQAADAKAAVDAYNEKFGIKPTPNPIFERSTRATSRTKRPAVFKIAAPSNLKSANGGPDCAAHVGLLAALVCPDLIKNGNLLLVWDWQATTGPEDIDGYRVYRVDSGLKQLVDTRTPKEQTLSGLANSAAGNGKCYAVSAFAGAQESDVSSPFCAGGGSVAKTARLSAVHTRASMQQNVSSNNERPEQPPDSVGFHYESYQGGLLVHDENRNYISRFGVAFDVSSLQSKKLVSAKLHLTIAASRGAGNNHSCATDVGTGSEFWWQNGSWLDGSFGYGIVPTDTGPEVTANVTSIVAPWLRGEPNYGFVLKNGDENLAAFTNKECVTRYAHPVLEITYY